MLIVLMGVSGAGKTTIGRALSLALSWPFLDADDYHPAASLSKMSSGIPLEDTDRKPWLEEIVKAVRRGLCSDSNLILACSALTRSSRRILRAVGAETRFILLEGPPELIRQRLSGRSGHFMPAELLASQFATLEAPCDALRLDVAAEPSEIVARIRRELRRLDASAHDPIMGKGG